MLPTTQYESKCLLRRLPKIDDGTVCLPPFLLTYSFPCFHYASSSSSSTSPSTSPSASSSSSSINKRIYIFIQWLNNYILLLYEVTKNFNTKKFYNSPSPSSKSSSPSGISSSSSSSSPSPSTSSSSSTSSSISSSSTSPSPFSSFFCFFVSSFFS